MPYAITEIAAAQPQTTYVRPAKLNVFICDVSGSMAPHMRQLSEDTIARVERLPLNDGLLLGLFSSQGWYRWPVARVLDTPEEYATIAAIIRRELHARNMTCFSEILTDTPKALKPLLGTFQVVTCTFMSDGQPVTNDNTREERAMLTAARELAPFLSAGAVIAYGDYANRQLLSQLAATLGIELVTAETVQQIGETFARTTDSHAKKRRKVTLPKETTFAFSMDTAGNVAALDTQQDVLVDEGASVYAIDNTPLATGKAPPGTQTLWSEPIVYGHALALLQQQQSDEALNALSHLGDVALVQSLSNALTNAELGKVEAQLRQCITTPAARFAQGKQVGCLPQDDAFDLLDLLTLLMADPDCRFSPRHPAFQYKRIGRTSRVQDGYPAFLPSTDVSAPLSRLVGHSSELNLSIGVSIPGTIALPESAGPASAPHAYRRDVIGLPEVYATHIFRNYALIANALPQVTQLPLTFSNNQSAAFEKIGHLCINPDDTAAHICILDLTQFPVCNRQRGREACDWGKLADLALESLKLGSIAKVLRAKRDELDPQREGEQPVALTPEQAAFLEACGVRRDGSLAPPTVQDAATDVLDIRTFEVKVKNGSPVSMKDFALMVEGKKKVNYVGELMMEGQGVLQSLPRQKAAALAWLQAGIQGYENQKRGMDADLNARRFAVALTGAWARSWDKDEVVVQASDGHEVTMRFEVKQKAI